MSMQGQIQEGAVISNNFTVEVIARAGGVPLPMPPLVATDVGELTETFQLATMPDKTKQVTGSSSVENVDISLALHHRLEIEALNLWRIAVKTGGPQAKQDVLIFYKGADGSIKRTAHLKGVTLASIAFDALAMADDGAMVKAKASLSVDDLDWI